MDPPLPSWKILPTTFANSTNLANFAKNITSKRGEALPPNWIKTGLNFTIIANKARFSEIEGGGGQ